MSPTRRQFLAGALATVGAGAIASTFEADAASATTATVRTPTDPATSGIDHIVVLMMENRSFDHYLGWLPGADGRQAGLSYVDRDGRRRSTHHLTDFQGCDHPDPDHSYEGGRIQLARGRCDGFLRSGENDEFAIGYYTEADLPFTGRAARAWCTFDRYFSATMAETYPNRFYQHAAATDRLHNSSTTSSLPTIWDRLAAKRITGRYYFVDAPFTALWGQRYVPISRPFDAFLADCASGGLPAVSFVDPKFLDEGSGSSADDHPHADIRAGQWFLNQVYEAVTAGPGWDRTALVVNYDEWGGFFDHVAPATAPDPRPDLGTGLRGFRVPCLLISPYARRGTVGHEVYDHTSILKMIEWRFGLAPLTVRDEGARNLAEVLDLRAPANLDAPRWTVPPVAPAACDSSLPAAVPVASPAGVDDPYAGWRQLRSLATGLGFPASVTI
ncbi:MAG: alkaline phosphatase family protein [Acidimicrobiales bacterium]|nr:alkaline phosphatase family protein [Acidimicrobiales bacterium]